MSYPVMAKAELIILISPIADDPYYQEVQSDIIDFQIHFAQKIQKAGDNVLILSDPGLRTKYEAVLPPDIIIDYKVEDIWARDFSPSHSRSSIGFRYSAEGQGGDQYQADQVQEGLYALIDEAGLQITSTNLVNDGGNWVDDEAGNVVISRKFLRDNALTEEQARRQLLANPSIQNVAFIEADEQGGLEHSDGVVSFIAPKTLLVNSYPEDPDYEEALIADLRRGIPGLTIIPIVTPYDGRDIYDEKFGSACGLYTNALVTPDRIYVPQFNIPEDKDALETLKKHSNKDLIPVSSDGVCFMGGGVRCMSWQLRGENAAQFKRAMTR